MAKALIVYATRTGKTEAIAQKIAEGIKSTGVEVKVAQAKTISRLDELLGYDGYVFGSPTYHGEMMTEMKTLLFMAEKANLEGKIGGAFGSYGWSGEAPDRIYQTLKNIFNLKLPNSALKIKSSFSSIGDTHQALIYGQEIGQMIKAQKTNL
jgi:flavorubredoxin